MLLSHIFSDFPTMRRFLATTMRIASRPFNSFFLAAAVALGWSGGYQALGAASSTDRSTNAPTSSQSSKPEDPKDPKKKVKKEKPMAMIRFFAEVTDDGTVQKVEVIRSFPQKFPIMREPFMDERDVARATLLETADGGFVIRVDATPHGRQAMEMATVAINGRHVVIFCQWNVDGQKQPEARWLGAPLVRTPLHNGSIVFSADCTREEAQRIVDGLNNVAVKLKNQPKSKPPKEPKKKNDPKTNQNKPPSSSDSAAQELLDKNQQQKQQPQP